MTLSDTGAGESITVGQLNIRYLIDGSATGGMGVFELTVPTNAPVPPPHSHTHNEECVYVLAGRLRYSVDGVVRDLTRGEWMFTPRGSVHHFSNPHDGTARALVVLTPDIGAQYFVEVGALIKADGPPDHEKLIGVMARYGLAPARPQ
jgi:mannose-6-phosphate isomerase-like protein (cupin superfamily)